MEAYGDGNLDEIQVGMDCLAAEVAVSDIGGYHLPVFGLAALAMGMAKGPAWSEGDAAFAGHRDSDCGGNCEGGCEDLDAGEDDLGDEEEDDEGVVGDEEEGKNRGCGSAVAGAWMWEVLIPYHFAVRSSEGVCLNALGRAALVVLGLSKDARFVDCESHQLDIVDRSAGAGV